MFSFHLVTRQWDSACNHSFSIPVEAVSPPYNDFPKNIDFLRHFYTTNLYIKLFIVKELAATIIFSGTVEFPLCILSLDGFPFIKTFFAPCNGNLNLNLPIFKINF